MIRFLLKGVIRDKQRSVIPMLVVSFGVMLTVVFHCWIKGVLGESTEMMAKYDTGHVKIMTRTYSENADQIPNDLAYIGVNELINKLSTVYPSIDWAPRIKFGGLLDVPDKNGETKTQGPAMGMAVDLLSPETKEIKRLNISEAIVKGEISQKPGDILISNELATKLKIGTGDPVTLISTTMYGSMAMHNFTISGTINFGVSALDRGAMIMDISDARYVLDMDDAAGEILGFFQNGFYNREKAHEITEEFNQEYKDTKDEFAPQMLALSEMNSMKDIIELADSFVGIVLAVFILAMAIVLWNAGLIGGLRRYGEIGIRLAIGENKGHIYRSMIIESLAAAVTGTALGTFIGLFLAYLLQEYGIDLSAAMKNTTMMMPAKFKAQITPGAFYIGIIPGIVSTIVGTMLSGIGIYKRKTAQLFKELES